MQFASIDRALAKEQQEQIRRKQSPYKKGFSCINSVIFVQSSKKLLPQTDAKIP